MPATPDIIRQWRQALLAAGAGGPQLSLQDYLSAIPRLDSLSDVPAGTVVLVRGDLDAKPGAQIGEGDIRLRSMVETLKHGRDRGWKQVVFGHIGRKPEGSLNKVARRLGELLECEVPLLTDWLDEGAMRVPDAARQRIEAMAQGDVLMLENARRYDIERVLWDVDPAVAEKLDEPLARYANALADGIGRVYVNEALSAGSLDSSATIAPAAMDRVALGRYVAGEFDGPMRRCLATQLVVFSGLKTDKLDDLQAMIARGTIEWVFTAGSLAMALKKAAAELSGSDFCLGVAEDPAHADKPYYIARERIDQARRMLEEGQGKGIRFVLPVDFVLQDGRAADAIGPGDQQFDVGPKTSALFAEQIGEFLSSARRPAVAFYNGVFGMFEDPRFEEGTRRFVSELKRLKDGGVEVYVGGGEGGTAIERYGKPDWITHCFTAGGTVLNALGSNPVPYLQSLRMAAQK